MLADVMRRRRGEVRRAIPGELKRSLLDTDILSEIRKTIDPVVARDAIADRKAFGRYMSWTAVVVEVIRGFQERQGIRRLRAIVTSESVIQAYTRA
jgi:hypothetical protein